MWRIRSWTVFLPMDGKVRPGDFRPLDPECQVALESRCSVETSWRSQLLWKEAAEPRGRSESLSLRKNTSFTSDAALAEVETSRSPLAHDVPPPPTASARQWRENSQMFTWDIGVHPASPTCLMKPAPTSLRGTEILILILGQVVVVELIQQNQH
ncbi:hypothetical protein INR49_026037 [Caranx melampygus]|nr:hypothetical protein INR49_026037 [Caranx melampygus]